MSKRSLYKIIHTSAGTGWGETEQRILKESAWMEAQGHQAVIISPLKSPLYIKGRSHGLTVYPLSFKPLARIGEYGRIQQIFMTEKPFVVNSHGLADAQLALKAARKTGVQCRIMSHHQGTRIKKFWGCNTLYKKYSHYVLTDCESASRSIQHFFKLKNIRIFSVPCGIIEPQRLPGRQAARQKMALQLGLSQDTRFLGINGQCMPDIKTDFLLQFFTTLNAEIPHHLLVAMDAAHPLSNEAKTAIEKKTQKRIHFINPAIDNTATDIWHFYSALDCGIFFPKQHKKQRAQGIPLPILEAMYAQCPVVAPDRPGITDIIEPEKNGLLFSDGDIAQLLETVRQTVCHKTDGRERIRAAQRHVKKHHTITTMGRDILRLYRIHQARLEKRLMA